MFLHQLIDTSLLHLNAAYLLANHIALESIICIPLSLQSQAEVFQENIDAQQCIFINASLTFNLKNNVCETSQILIFCLILMNCLIFMHNNRFNIVDSICRYQFWANASDKLQCTCMLQFLKVSCMQSSLEHISILLLLFQYK